MMSRIEKRRGKDKKRESLGLKGFLLHGIASGVTREVVQYIIKLLTSS